MNKMSFWAIHDALDIATMKPHLILGITLSIVCHVNNSDTLYMTIPF